MDEFSSRFKSAVDLFEVELYWEAIDAFKVLTKEFSGASTLDEVYINIAVSYMRLGLMHEAEDYFSPVFEGEVGSGRFEKGENNFGSTKSRAALGLLRINCASGNLDAAQKIIELLNSDNESGMYEGGEKHLFREIASSELESAREYLAQEL